MKYLYTALIGFAITIIGIAIKDDVVSLAGALIGGVSIIMFCIDNMANKEKGDDSNA